jgi:ketopantoate reductase
MRRTIGPIREHPQTRAFLLDLMREVVAVGRAHGVALPDDYAELRLKLADDVAADMTSSMHHDLERGNPLEVRWLAVPSSSWDAPAAWRRRSTGPWPTSWPCMPTGSAR